MTKEAKRSQMPLETRVQRRTEVGKSASEKLLRVSSLISALKNKR